MRRIMVWLLALSALFLLTVFAFVWFAMRGSLPQLDGQAVAAVEQPVTIERDAAGVPTIRAQSRTDVAVALGFLHGQERFFQMDLLRRSASGTLSELIPAAAEFDKQVRLHDFAALADQTFARLSSAELELAEAYAAGVNQGLAALDVTPFEYLLLRLDPEPWRAGDALLVSLAMWLDLQDERGQQEAARHVIDKSLGGRVLEWLDPAKSGWDAPLIGDTGVAPPLPSPADFDLRSSVAESAEPAREEAVAGSNNFAVRGALSEHGGALLEDDMHLSHRVPNIWFRAGWIVGDGALVHGLTLPGTPLMVVGSNGRLAWGFTNSAGDYLDLIELEIDPQTGCYQTPRGCLDFVERVERFGADGEVRETYRDTGYGPVIEHHGRSFAIRWLAHQPAAHNLRLLGIEDAGSVVEAIALAPEVGMPPQNLMVADADGNIGWTIIGMLPARERDFDASLPMPSKTTEMGPWRRVPSKAYPRLVNPPSGRLWTANGRTVDDEGMALIGTHGFAFGARSQRIRELLFARSRFDEQALLEIALDTRSRFFDEWAEVLLTVPTTAARASALQIILQSEIAAEPDNVAFRIVYAFRERVRDVWLPSVDALLDVDQATAARLRKEDGAVLAAARSRAPHLLPGGHASWDAFLGGILDGIIDDLPEDLPSAGWGGRNTAAIRNPVAGVFPDLIAGHFHAPRDPLPGAYFVPRAQTPAFGASMRMVVSPGKEDRGIMHMPVGQSRHPMSPYFLAGHDDWVQGRPSEFLPGETLYRLELLPAAPEGGD